MRHTKLKLIFDKTQLSETARTLLFLIPLVQIAWAQGAISPREKHLIFPAAREDLIDERHAMNDPLGELLKYQPSREFFDDCFAMIREKLRQMTVRDRTDLHDKILRRCRAVAASAGGKSLMDSHHHISPEEKNLLGQFAEILK